MIWKKNGEKKLNEEEEEEEENENANLNYDRHFDWELIVGKDYEFKTIQSAINEEKPISRILLMVKIVQVVDPQQKRRDKEKEKELNKDTIQNYINELKSILKDFKNQSNIMLIFVGTGYCFLGVENTTEDIMELIKISQKKTKMVENVHIITFNEECPTSNFPVFYKYEGEVYDKESQSYKDLSSPEKAWILYDNYFCNLGMIIFALFIYIKNNLYKLLNNLNINFL